MTQLRFKHVAFVLALVLLVIAGSLYLAARAPFTNIAFPTPAAERPNPVPAVTTSSTQPRIVWSQSAITIFLLPSDIKQRNLSFTSNVALHNVSIAATPEIAPFLNLTPSKISDLAPNEVQSIQLRAMAPSIATIGSAFDGTLRVNSQSSTIPQNLKVLVTVGLPPDPGAAGNATLAGVDSDGDGVRDDVQRYIGLTYPQSAKKRAALTQVTIALQDEVTGRSTGVQEVTDAMDCMDYAFMSSDADVNGVEMDNDAYNALEAIVLNTPDRAKASVQAEGRAAIMQFSTPYAQKAGKCVINPSLFPN